MHGYSTFAANNNLCIALTNYSATAVDFDSLMSPGGAYTVQPKQTAILSSDHMVGACIPTDGLCTVIVNSLFHGGDDYVLIDSLPRGTRIIYGGAKDYYLDKNANVACVNRS